MTFRIQVTTTRPSVDVPFFSQYNPELWDQAMEVLAQHKLSGLLLSDSRRLSDDGLVSTYIGNWVSQFAYDEKNSEPIFAQMIYARENYHNSVGITRVVTESTI